MCPHKKWLSWLPSQHLRLPRSTWSLRWTTRTWPAQQIIYLCSRTQVVLKLWNLSQKHKTMQHLKKKKTHTHISIATQPFVLCYCRAPDRKNSWIQYTPKASESISSAARAVGFTAIAWNTISVQVHNRHCSCCPGAGTQCDLNGFLVMPSSEVESELVLSIGSYQSLNSAALRATECVGKTLVFSFDCFNESFFSSTRKLSSHCIPKPATIIVVQEK